MDRTSRGTTPTLVPYFGYRGAAGALRWLAEAFGFEKTLEYAADDGTIMHAEMSFGSGMVMVGMGEPPDEGRAARTSLTGHGIYVVVDDVDAHHERTRAAGGRIA